MKLHYHVIDDVPADVDRLIQEADKTQELKHVASYSSVYAALADYRQKKQVIPIIFCDIRLREENGLDAGPELTKYCKYLVFVTGLPGQKGKVLDARGDDHLQKPVTCDQIRMRVLDRFYKRHGDELPLYIHLNKLFVYDGTKKNYHCEKLKNILFISHDANYLDIAAKNSKRYTVRATVAHAYSLLEPAGIFVRVNKGTILNMKYVTKWDGTEAWIGETVFNLLGEGKKAFKDYIKRYKLGNGGAKGGI